MRNNSKPVYDFVSGNLNLNQCLNDYDEKVRNIEEANKQLVRTGDRNAILKIKAEIHDNEIHRNDLKAKVDYYTKIVNDLSKDSAVKNYQALTNQIEKIKEVQKSKRDSLEELKNEIQVRNRQLEEIRKSS